MHFSHFPNIHYILKSRIGWPVSVSSTWYTSSSNEINYMNSFCRIVEERRNILKICKKNYHFEILLKFCCKTELRQWAMPTALGQVVACAHVMQQARVQSPVGTSFLGEFFRGFSTPIRQMSGTFRPPGFPNIIWPSLSSIIIHYGCQWPEMLMCPKTSNIHIYDEPYNAQTLTEGLYIWSSSEDRLTDQS